MPKQKIKPTGKPNRRRKTLPRLQLEADPEPTARQTKGGKAPVTVDAVAAEAGDGLSQQTGVLALPGKPQVNQCPSPIAGKELFSIGGDEVGRTAAVAQLKHLPSFLRPRVRSVQQDWRSSLICWISCRTAAISARTSRVETGPSCRHRPLAADRAFPSGVRGPVARVHGLVRRAAARNRCRPASVNGPRF